MKPARPEDKFIFIPPLLNSPLNTLENCFCVPPRLFIQAWLLSIYRLQFSFMESVAISQWKLLNATQEKDTHSPPQPPYQSALSRLGLGLLEHGNAAYIAS